MTDAHFSGIEHASLRFPAHNKDYFTSMDQVCATVSLRRALGISKVKSAPFCRPEVRLKPTWTISRLAYCSSDTTTSCNISRNSLNLWYNGVWIIYEYHSRSNFNLLSVEWSVVELRCRDYHNVSSIAYSSKYTLILRDISSNCCWTAYRLLILLCSYLGFFLLTHPIFRFPSSRPQTCSPHHHPSQEIIRRYQDSDFKHLEEGRSPVSVDSPSFLNKDWRDRRRERLQLAWNLCSRSGGGITTPGSFRESSKNRNLDYPSTPSPVWLAVDRFTHERKLEKMNRRSQRAAEKAEATKVGEAPFSPRSPKVNKGKAPKWRGIAPYVTSPPTVCISPLESSPSPQARSLPFSAPPLLAPPSPILHSNYDRLSTLSTPQLFSCFSNVTNDTATSSDPRSPSPTRSQLQQYPFSVPPVIVLAPDSSDGASTLDPFAFDRDIVELSSARGGITFTNPFTSPRSPPSPASPSPATFADLSTPVSVGSDALRLVTARKPVERRKALLEQIQNFTNEERELDRQEVLRRRSRSMRASLQEPRRPSIECDRVVDQGAALSIPPSAAASLYSPPSRESLIVRMSTPSSAEWLENRVRLNSHRASIS